MCRPLALARGGASASARGGPAACGRAPVVLLPVVRRAVVRRAVVRPVERRAVVPRAVVRRAAVPCARCDFRAAGLRAVDLRAADLRAVDLRAVDLRAVLARGCAVLDGLLELLAKALKALASVLDVPLDLLERRAGARVDVLARGFRRFSNASSDVFMRRTVALTTGGAARGRAASGGLAGRRPTSGGPRVTTWSGRSRCGSSCSCAPSSCARRLICRRSFGWLFCEQLETSDSSR